VLTEQPGAETEKGAGGKQRVCAALAKPPNGGRVVGSIEDGGEWCHFWEGKPELSDVAGELDVVDREVAGRVQGQDKAGGPRGAPGMAPNGCRWDEQRCLPCRGRTHRSLWSMWGSRDYFVDVRGPRGKRVQEQLPVVQFVVDGCGQPDAVARAFEGGIEAREEAEPLW
jgi:hypothetical protein